MNGDSAGLTQAEYNDTLRRVYSMKVAELKDMCRSLNFKMAGKKQELVDRIQEYAALPQSDPIRMLAFRTLVLKRSNGEPLPSAVDLYNAIRSGQYNPNQHSQWQGATTAQNQQSPHPQNNVFAQAPPPAQRTYSSPHQNHPQTQNQTQSAHHNHPHPHQTHPTSAHVHSYRPAEPVRSYESIPYKEHSLYFKKSPFYTLRRLVHGSPQLCPPSKSRGICPFNFVLSKEESALINSGDPSVRVYLLCGLQGNSGSPSTTEVSLDFPSPSELSINDEQVIRNFKGIKGKPGTAKPADITDFLKQRPSLNKVQLVYTQTNDTYLVYLYIVNTISCEEVMRQIESRPKLHKKYTIDKIVQQNSDPDDDIVISSSSVTLRDPLSYTKMKFPVQSMFCNHAQCFDGLIFLQSQLQLPTWRCPICQNPVRIEDLAISEYFLEVLAQVPESVDSVQINQDGTWELEAVPEGDEDKSRQSAGQESPEPEAISLSDEEDEPPRPVVAESGPVSAPPTTDQFIPSSAPPAVSSQSVQHSAPPRREIPPEIEIVSLDTDSEDEPEPTRPEPATIRQEAPPPPSQSHTHTTSNPMHIEQRNVQPDVSLARSNFERLRHTHPYPNSPPPPPPTANLQHNSQQSYMRSNINILNGTDHVYPSPGSHLSNASQSQNQRSPSFSSPNQTHPHTYPQLRSPSVDPNNPLTAFQIPAHRQSYNFLPGSANSQVNHANNNERVSSQERSALVPPSFPPTQREVQNESRENNNTNKLSTVQPQVVPSQEIESVHSSAPNSASVPQEETFRNTTTEASAPTIPSQQTTAPSISEFISSITMDTTPAVTAAPQPPQPSHVLPPLPPPPPPPPPAPQNPVIERTNILSPEYSAKVSPPVQSQARVFGPSPFAHLYNNGTNTYQASNISPAPTATPSPINSNFQKPVEGNDPAQVIGRPVSSWEGSPDAHSSGNERAPEKAFESTSASPPVAQPNVISEPQREEEGSLPIEDIQYDTPMEQVSDANSAQSSSLSDVTLSNVNDPLSLEGERETEDIVMGNENTLETIAIAEPERAETQNVSNAPLIELSGKNGTNLSEISPPNERETSVVNTPENLAIVRPVLEAVLSEDDDPRAEQEVANKSARPLDVSRLITTRSPELQAKLARRKQDITRKLKERELAAETTNGQAVVDPSRRPYESQTRRPSYSTSGRRPSEINNENPARAPTENGNQVVASSANNSHGANQNLEKQRPSNSIPPTQVSRPSQVRANSEIIPQNIKHFAQSNGNEQRRSSDSKAHSGHVSTNSANLTSALKSVGGGASFSLGNTRKPDQNSGVTTGTGPRSFSEYTASRRSSTETSTVRRVSGDNSLGEKDPRVNGQSRERTSWSPNESNLPDERGTTYSNGTQPINSASAQTQTPVASNTANSSSTRESYPLRFRDLLEAQDRQRREREQRPPNQHSFSRPIESGENVDIRGRLDGIYSTVQRPTEEPRLNVTGERDKNAPTPTITTPQSIRYSRSAFDISKETRDKEAAPAQKKQKVTGILGISINEDSLAPGQTGISPLNGRINNMRLETPVSNRAIDRLRDESDGE